METLSTFVLTSAAARDLTDRINTTSADLAAMLQIAHDGKAWLALGYRSWKDYLAEEIKLSKQHAHRLLAFAQLREDIEKSPMGDLPLPTSERQVRSLAFLPPEDRPKVYAKAVESAGGLIPTAKQVEDAVAIARCIEPPIQEPEKDPWRRFRPTAQQVEKYGLNLPPECPGRIYFETDECGNTPTSGRFAILAPYAHDRNFVFTAWLEHDDFNSQGGSIVGRKKAMRIGLEGQFADFLDSWPGYEIRELQQLASDEVGKNKEPHSGPWEYNCLLYYSREEWLREGLGIRAQRNRRTNE